MTQTKIEQVYNAMTGYIEFDGKGGGYWMPPQLADKLEVWEVREGDEVKLDIRFRESMP